MDFDIARNIIKQKLTLREIIEYYLGQPASNGRWKCPIHNGEHFNFMINSKRTWKCFSCGANGDEIELVMKMFNLSCPMAIKKILTDFNIACEDGNNDKIRKELERQAQQREKDKKIALAIKKLEMVVFDTLIEQRDKCEDILKKNKPHNSSRLESYQEFGYAERFIKAEKQLEVINAYLDIISCKDIKEPFAYMYPANTREEKENRKNSFLRGCFRRHIKYKGLI